MPKYGNRDWFYDATVGDVSAAVPFVVKAKLLATVANATRAQMYGGTETDLPFGAAENIEVSSSNSNDTSAGIGAKTVTISGLDASGVAQSEVLSMDGVTPVASLSSYLRIFNFEVTTVGSQLAAVGQLTLEGATSSSEHAVILAGDNISYPGVYRVPTGKQATVLQMQSQLIKEKKDQNYQIHLMTRAPAVDSPWVDRIVSYLSTKTHTSETAFNPVGLSLPAGTDMKLVYSSGEKDNTVIAKVFMMVEDV